jgi:hypothetical protein
MVIETLKRIAARRFAAHRTAAQRTADPPATGLKTPAMGPTVGRWHAVSVLASGECCTAARMLQRSRFLSADAPALPLAGCPARQSCSCFYKHHDDRRGQPRRREEITGLRANVRVVQERRHERDRRRSDAW